MGSTFTLKGEAMKLKKFAKKLKLNKKTIADLDIREMEKIQGGIKRPPSSQCVSVCGGPFC